MNYAENIAAGPLGELKRARCMIREGDQIEPGDVWKVRVRLDAAINELSDPSGVGRLMDDLLERENERLADIRLAEREAKERSTCSVCLARTYRGNEECVCEDGGDAEDYAEALAQEMAR